MSGPSHHIEGLEIDQLLARGGSASVYEAFDRRHSRKVAVKILDSRDFEAPKRRAFRRELEAMGRLDDHPYVLSVFDSGFTEDGSPYLVMPLVATGTVAQRISRGEEFAIDELLSVAVKLGSALETAHQRGILHCDIKPSNLFIGPFGDPMLGDLGISSVSESGVTATNRVSLTLRYAAPEIVDGAEHSVQSDIYSLGATLFAMTDLVPPFDERNKAALVSQIVSAPKPPALARDVPEPFAELIYDMMAADPQRRPHSALEVVERLQAIERLRGGEPTAAAIVRAGEAPGSGDGVLTAGREPMLAIPGTAPPASRRGRVAAIAALAGLLLAVAGVAFWVRSDSDSTASVSAERATAAGPEGSLADEPTTSPPTPVPATPEPATPVPATPVPTISLATPEPSPEVAAAPLALPTVEPTAEPTAEPTTEQAAEPPTITGTVLSVAGGPVASMEVDLFAAAQGRPRGDFIEGVLTDSDGRYRFVAPAACYVLTFIAPEGSIVEGGSQHRNVPVCVDTSLAPATVDTTVAEQPVADAAIGGVVRLLGQALPVADVHVDAFISEGEQARGAFVSGIDSVADGSYRFELPAGCYILTVTAPDGLTVVGGDRFLNSPTICVETQNTAVFDVELQ